MSTSPASSVPQRRVVAAHMAEASIDSSIPVENSSKPSETKSSVSDSAAPLTPPTASASTQPAAVKKTGTLVWWCPVHKPCHKRPLRSPLRMPNKVCHHHHLQHKQSCAPHPRTHHHATAEPHTLGSVLYATSSKWTPWVRGEKARYLEFKTGSDYAQLLKVLVSDKDELRLTVTWRSDIPVPAKNSAYKVPFKIDAALGFKPFHACENGNVYSYTTETNKETWDVWLYIDKTHIFSSYDQSHALGHELHKLMVERVSSIDLGLNSDSMEYESQYWIPEMEFSWSFLSRNNNYPEQKSVITTPDQPAASASVSSAPPPPSVPPPLPTTSTPMSAESKENADLIVSLPAVGTVPRPSGPPTEPPVASLVKGPSAPPLNTAAPPPNAATPSPNTDDSSPAFIVLACSPKPSEP